MYLEQIVQISSKFWSPKLAKQPVQNSKHKMNGPHKSQKNGGQQNFNVSQEWKYFVL